MKEEYTYFVSGNAPSLYPTEVYMGYLGIFKAPSIPIPQRHPYQGEWGDVLATEILDDLPTTLPDTIKAIWLSITEAAFYSIEETLPVDLLQKKWDEIIGDGIGYIVVGMAPYGGLALWIHSTDKSVLIKWAHAVSHSMPFSEYMPNSQYMSAQHYCHNYLNLLPEAKAHLEQYGLPTKSLYNQYMRQYTYRYLPLFERWNSDKERWEKYDGEKDKDERPTFNYIEEALFDGSHDKLHDGGLLRMHEAGKPKKLAISWKIKKSEYNAYFWFDDAGIRDVFEHFYGAHPEVKADFIIHIDPNANKYELALYRYGLNEPQVINLNTYQLIVFKNRFEHFRSKNYKQASGAWLW